jgi:hypothetical protein
MQIVNGYVCMNCCDIDKARLGQDPHQSADQLKKQVEQRLDPLATKKFGPAVTFGGALQANNSGDGGEAVANANVPSDGQNSAPAFANVDILV